MKLAADFSFCKHNYSSIIPSAFQAHIVLAYNLAFFSTRRYTLGTKSHTRNDDHEVQVRWSPSLYSAERCPSDHFLTVGTNRYGRCPQRIILPFLPRFSGIPQLIQRFVARRSHWPNHKTRSWRRSHRRLSHIHNSSLCMTAVSPPMDVLNDIHFLRQDNANLLKEVMSLRQQSALLRNRSDDLERKLRSCVVSATTVRHTQQVCQSLPRTTLTWHNGITLHHHAAPTPRAPRACVLGNTQKNTARSDA